MALEDLMTGNITKMTDEDLVNHVINARQYVEETIRTKRDRWQAAWDAYLGRMDFSKKAEWQSKNKLPKFSQAVRITKNMMKQSMIKAEDFFAFQGTNDNARNVENDITKAVKQVLDQSKFKQKHFANAVFRGLLENLLIFKTWVEPLGDDQPVHEQQSYKFPIQVVSAFDFYVDPTGRKKFIIHRIKMDLSDFRRLVARKVYTFEALEAVQEDFERHEEELKERLRKGEDDAPKPSWRNEVELLEYWGDIDDNKGNTIHRNVTMTVVNGKYLARKPVENPFRHKKPPFVWGPIFELEGSEYHEGFADHVLNTVNMINETLNLILDSHLASSVKAYEVDLSLVHNPSSLKSGIYPGKVIQVNGVMPGQQAVREFTLGSVNPSSLQVLASLDREFQNSTGVNEFISGIVGVGSKTATESKLKSSQSIGFMQAVSEDIEDNSITPFIEMVYQNILQYNPEIFGDKVNLMPINDLKYKYEVKGMSKILSQMDELSKMFQWIGMVASTPIGQQLNWTEIGKMSAQWINQDPGKLLLQVAQESRDIGQSPAPQEAAKTQGMLQLLQNQGGA